MLDAVASYARLAPAAVMLVITLVLFALTFWVSRYAQRSARIIWAASNAPVVSVASGAKGLVKVRGTAEPPPPPFGFDGSTIVYSSSSRSNSINGRTRRTSSRTTGFIYLKSEDGTCAVNVAQARVVSTTSKSEHGPVFQDGGPYTTEAVIARGDSVFALGELSRGAPRGANVPGVRCELKPCRGVLVYSGSPERTVQVEYAIWFALQALPVVLLLVITLWIPISHVRGYPQGERNRMLTFLEALRRAPFRVEPGFTPGEAAATTE